MAPPETRGIPARLFARLVDTRGDPAAGFEQSAREAIPGNFFRAIGATFLVQLGDVLSGPKITLAWLLGAVGAPSYLIGLLVPIRESGSMLPQFAIAPFVQRRRIRKWVWVAGSLAQALAVAGIGCAILLFDGAVAGWLIVVLLCLFSIARAFSSIAAKDVLGRTIPKRWRGQTTAWGASAAGLVTLATGLVLALTPTGSGDIRLYALIVFAAAVLWLLAAAVYAGVHELPDQPAGRHAVSSDALATLRLLSTDPLLRRFVIARCLLLSTALSAPFYISLAQTGHESTASLLGAFIVASGLASLLSSPFWGRFADRSSRKTMSLGAVLASAAGVAVFAIDRVNPTLFEAVWLLPTLSFCLAIAHQGARIGRKTYVVDMATGNRRTDYVAASNTAVGLVLLIAGLLSAAGSVLSTSGVILALSLLGLAGAWRAYRLPEALADELSESHSSG